MINFEICVLNNELSLAKDYVTDLLGGTSKLKIILTWTIIK